MDDRWKNTLLMAVSVLVVLAMFEAYFSSEHEIMKTMIDAGADDMGRCTMPDDELIYTFRPGECGANSYGFYDYEYPKEKPEGVARYIVIGDSVAQGHGLNFTDSFPKVLEKKLGDGYEVLSFARTGYSISQEMVLLDQALEWNPDLIIWSYVLNDPAHPVYMNANGYLGQYYYDPPSHLVDFIQRKLYIMNGTMREDECGMDFHNMIHCAYWDDARDSIMEIGQKGVPVLFVIHPVFINNPAYPYDAVHQKVRKTAEDAGMRVLDIRDAYENHATDEVQYERNDPWHPSRTGHQLIAEYIYDNL